MQISKPIMSVDSAEVEAAQEMSPEKVKSRSQSSRKTTTVAK